MGGKVKLPSTAVVAEDMAVLVEGGGCGVPGRGDTDVMITMDGSVESGRTRG